MKLDALEAERSYALHLVAEVGGEIHRAEAHKAVVALYLRGEPVIGAAAEATLVKTVGKRRERHGLVDAAVVHQAHERVDRAFRTKLFWKNMGVICKYHGYPSR